MRVMLTLLVECNRTGVLSEPDYFEGEKERVSKTAVIEYVKEATENWSGQMPNGHPLRTLKVVAISGMEVK